MAGQGPHESQGHARSSRRGWSVRRAAEGSAAASGPLRGKRAKPTLKSVNKGSRPDRPLLGAQSRHPRPRTTDGSQTTQTPSQRPTAASHALAPLSTLLTPTTGSDAKARVICRLLELRGLSSEEAARLTAYLYGFPTTDLRWSLQQLNRLLFLRRLREAGAFDGGQPTRPS